jgi:sugar phosphate isomerase/epimerase
MTTPTETGGPAVRLHPRIEALPSGTASAVDLAAVRAAAEHLPAVELGIDFALDSVTPDLIAGLTQIKHERDIAYSVHAPYRDLNIASLNDGVFNAAKSDMLQAMDLAIAVGARVLNVHPGIHAYFPPARYADMKARERDVVEALCRKGEPHGVLVAIENLIETNAHFEDTWTLDGVIDLVERIDSAALGFCLDTGHAHQAGLDIPAAIRRLAGVQAGAGRIRPSALVHMHVHDNHGGPIDEHLPIGDGSISWSDVIVALDEAGYQGATVFENRGVERQTLALERWNSLLLAPAA